jgi:flagellar biosynthesis/type III secretory pathway M-ring protein FliF/YscJ
VSFAVYLAGLLLIAAVAWAAASPLLAPTRSRRGVQEELPEEERWRRRKDEALAAIRDAEFDLHLGKLSGEDYRELRARLEAQALEAMAELERRGHGESR